MAISQGRLNQINPKVATHKERANHQIAEPKPSSNKPLSLFQIATHKYQRTKQKKASFSSHTQNSKFAITHTVYIGYSSRQRCKSFEQ